MLFQPVLKKICKDSFTQKWMSLAAAAAACFSSTACIKSQSVNQTSESDTQSLAQAAEILESIKCIAPAPRWYKSLWLDINAESNTLGRELMNHYMGCTGKTFTLRKEHFDSLPLSMVDDPFNPLQFFAQRSEELRKEGQLREGVEESVFEETILTSTHYGNTLGHFQLKLKGKLVLKKNEFGWITPRFEGYAQVFDRYDFNPSDSSQKDSWRGSDTELRVRLAHVALPGRAFDIVSDWFPMAFDVPKYAGDLFQTSRNESESGYSSYGEQLQLILMTELRSEKWAKAKNNERVSIVVRTMQRLHEAARKR